MYTPFHSYKDSELCKHIMANEHSAAIIELVQRVEGLSVSLDEVADVFYLEEDLKAAEEEIDSLKREVDDLNEQISDLEADVDRLKEELNKQEA